VSDEQVRVFMNYSQKIDATSNKKPQPNGEAQG